MNLFRFKEILEDVVTYVYPSLQINFEVEFLDQEMVVLKEDGTLNVKGDIHQSNGFNISIDRPFIPADVELLLIFFKEVNQIESYPNMNDDYKESLTQIAINSAISKTLSQTSSKTVLRVINQISRLSERTYEGNQITYGVIINNILKVDNRTDNLYFSDFLEDAYSAVLTNGIDSFLEIDSDGYILRYLQLNSEQSELGLSPFEYTRILEYCGSDSVGVVLSKNNEILIFHDHELKYTKRAGRWNPYSHKEIISLIHNKSRNDNYLFSKSVYLSALDCSFSQHGGIISFLDENRIEEALNHINIRDIVNEKYYNLKKQLLLKNCDADYVNFSDLSFQQFINETELSKVAVLNRLIGSKKFFQLHRKLREDLISVDGATVVDYNGEIVAVGAIIKIEAGSKGGGRVAAAKTLCNYGISIEISTDSSIRGFALDSDNHPQKIFTISEFESRI